MKRKIILVMLTITMITSLFFGQQVKADNLQDLATLLKMDGKWSNDHWISNEEDEHFYKIIIPSDGYFSFKIMSYIESGCNFDLYSEDMSEQYWGGGLLAGCGVGKGTETSPSAGSRYTSLSKGIYILKVSSGGGGKYKLWSTYTNYYVNDVNAISYDSPQDFSRGSTVTGALTETNSEDWYRIKIDKTGYYTFFWKCYVNYNGGNGATFKLHSSDLLSTIFDQELYGASDSQPKIWKQDIKLNTGTYYMKINASRGLFGDWVAAGKYILKWESLKQENCDHSYNKKSVSPTYLKKGYILHQCEKCGKKYKDNFTPKKILGRVWGRANASRKKVKLTWFVVSGASGYQIRYSKDKKMKKSIKIVTLKGGKRTKKTIVNLRSKKKYSFQIRAYRNIGDKKVYGKWSKKKRIKVK